MIIITITDVRLHTTPLRIRMPMLNTRLAETSKKLKTWGRPPRDHSRWARGRRRGSWADRAVTATAAALGPGAAGRGAQGARTVRATAAAVGQGGGAGGDKLGRHRRNTRHRPNRLYKAQLKRSKQSPKRLHKVPTNKQNLTVIRQGHLGP